MKDTCYAGKRGANAIIKIKGGKDKALPPARLCTLAQVLEILDTDTDRETHTDHDKNGRNDNGENVDDISLNARKRSAHRSNQISHKVPPFLCIFDMRNQLIE